MRDGPASQPACNDAAERHPGLTHREERWPVLFRRVVDQNLAARRRRCRIAEAEQDRADDHRR